MATKSTSTKSQAAKSAAKTPVEVAVEAGKETVETAAAGYEQAVEMTKKQVEKSSKAVREGYGDFAALSKENVEAAISSGTIMAKGFETLGKEVVSFARQSVEGNVAATTAILGAKSLNEVVDLQNDYARKSFDQFVAESTKLTELSVKVANDALAPIKARVDVAVEQFTKAANA